MHDLIQSLPSNVIQLIFSYFDLQARLNSQSVSNLWLSHLQESWKLVFKVKIFSLFPDQENLPMGSNLNKGLKWILKNCGPHLKILDFSDPSPQTGLFRTNERTYQIIGHYCPNLVELRFDDLLLYNDSLLDMCKYIDLKEVKVVIFRGSFCHYVDIYSGLEAIYEHCPNIEVIDLSNSLCARVRDNRELWPPTLKEVYVDNARALTGYSMYSLTQCCPGLEVLSMSTRSMGMHPELHMVMDYVPGLRKLHLVDYPGDVESGVLIGILHNLEELYLGPSTMVCDPVIEVIAANCTSLQVLDLGLYSGDMEAERSRHGFLTDHGLKQIALHLNCLKKLDLAGRHHVTDEVLAMIMAANQSLTSLSLAYCKKISSQTLANIPQMAPLLSSLDISDIFGLTTEDLSQFLQNWFRLAKSFRLLVHAWYMPIVTNFGELGSRLELVSGLSDREFTDSSVTPRKIVKVQTGYE